MKKIKKLLALGVATLGVSSFGLMVGGSVFASDVTDIVALFPTSVADVEQRLVFALESRS